ncbi:MAG: hypothetical protein ACOZIN_10580 [Myxococcota bacterium]
MALYANGSLSSTPPQAARPVWLSPHIDHLLARAQIDAYRREFAKNRVAVEQCERSSKELCRQDSRCVLADECDPLECEQVCRATEPIFHAWLQELDRRRCDESVNGVWLVYQASAHKSYGECTCPPPTLQAFISDGNISFSGEKGRCVTDREDCHDRGGTLRSPQHLQAAADHPLLAQGPPRSNRYDCERGSYTVDLHEGLFLHPRWIDTPNDSRCELTLLRGFLAPSRVQHDFFDPMPDDYLEFKTHLCQGAKR